MVKGSDTSRMHLEALEQSRRYAENLQSVNRDNRFLNEEDLFYASRAALSPMPNLLAIEANHGRRMLALGAPVYNQPSMSSATTTTRRSTASADNDLAMTSAQMFLRFPMLETPAAPSNSQNTQNAEPNANPKAESEASTKRSQDTEHLSQVSHRQSQLSLNQRRSVSIEEIYQLSQRTQSQLSISDKNNNDLLNEDELFALNENVEVDKEINTVTDSTQSKDSSPEKDRSRGKKRKVPDDDEDDTDNDDLLVAAEIMFRKSPCRSNDLVSDSRSASRAASTAETSLPSHNMVTTLPRNPYQNRMVQIPTSQAITMIGQSNTVNQDLSSEKKRPKLHNNQDDQCRMCDAPVKW